MRATVSKSIIVTAFAVAVTGNAQAEEGVAPETPSTQSSPVGSTGVKPRPAKKGVKPPAIEPEAIAALAEMGAFLREQQSFTVRTTTETDYVLDSGQKVRLSAHGELRVRRPDHLRADLVSDRKQRQVFYDGRTFTIHSPRVGYYATVAAPATILELADLLQGTYGLELPLVDLFRWGSDELEIELEDITSATHVGSTRLDGVQTDHYAFRQPGLDWQIWIQRGDRPLPRKLVLTTTDDPARPEHAIEMTWNLGARHEDAVFAFAPPSGSARIELAELIPPKADKTRRTKRSARR